jgi:hypothetical protein
MVGQEVGGLERVGCRAAVSPATPWPQLRGATRGATERKNVDEQIRWEYNIASIMMAAKERFKDYDWTSYEDVARQLNEWGDKGWELVNVVPSSTWIDGRVGAGEVIQVYAFFKRRCL